MSELGIAQSEGEVRERAPMHRLGSAKGLITNPQTLRERLIARRQELKMRQEDVADQLVSWNPRTKRMGKIARTTYGVYEAGEVIPSIPILLRIAEVLECAPEWLVFGIGTRVSIDEVQLNEDANTFVYKETWNFSEAWLARYDADPLDLVLCMADSFSQQFVPGDVALVHRDVEPERFERVGQNDHANFVFSEHGMLTIASLTGPSPERTYRVRGSSRHKAAYTVSAADIVLLGKVIGKLGEL